MEPFDYPDTLVENVKLLDREVKGKNETLAYVQTYLSKVDETQEEANRSFSYTRKKIEEIEKSLKESQEVRKRMRTSSMRCASRIFPCLTSYPN